MNELEPAPMWVLHVEDDPAVGERVATYLERHHDELDVESETNAADALADTRDHLDRTVRSLSRMEAIVEDVLTLAQDEELADSVESVDVVAVAERAWRPRGDARPRHVAVGRGGVRTDEELHSRPRCSSCN